MIWPIGFGANRQGMAFRASPSRIIIVNNLLSCSNLSRFRIAPMIYSSDEPQSIPTLFDALQTETVDTLKEQAKLISGSEQTKLVRKANLVEFIGQRMTGDHLQALWQRLDALQQAAVTETAHGPNPWFDADRFVVKYGQLPGPILTNRWVYPRKYSLLDLFFFDEIMPEDLRRRIKAFTPKPEPVQLSPLSEIPGEAALLYEEWDQKTRQKKTYRNMIPITCRLTERSGIHDLKAVLRLINAGKLAVSDKTRQPGVAGLKAMNPLLLGGDFYDDSGYGDDQKIGPFKSFAWPMLMQGGGLATLNGKTLELSKTGQKALGEPPEKTLAQIWQRWLKTTVFDELRRIDCIKGQTGKGQRGLTAVAKRRAAINQMLKHCPPGQWIAVNDLFRFMRVNGPNFEITRDLENLYVNEPMYGMDSMHCPDWMLLQARYALCLLFEYAATLGLLDVAYIPPHDARPDYRGWYGISDLPFFSRYDGLLYFRINPLGAYALGLAPGYQPAAPEIVTPEAPLIRVLPNLEIAAMGSRLEPADLMMLDRYANKVSDAVWKLDQARLLDALEAGHDLMTLAELLVALSGQPLPETVERLLEDIARRARSVQSKGTVWLIECADPALAALIANDSRTKPFCQTAGDRSLTVPLESETRFRSALRKLGYIIPK
jgi:hypothetical protein